MGAGFLFIFVGYGLVFLVAGRIILASIPQLGFSGAKLLIFMGGALVGCFVSALALELLRAGLSMPPQEENHLLMVLWLIAGPVGGSGLVWIIKHFRKPVPPPG